MKAVCQLSAILLSIILILSISTKAYAKRGCGLYGHSCYGGHGKRSEPQISSEDNQYMFNTFRNDPNKQLGVDMNELEQPINVGNDFYGNSEKEFRYVYNIMKQMIENSKRHSQSNTDIPDKITTNN